MEYLYLILIFLFQAIGLFGFVFAVLLIFKYNKVKDWFNKKAGETIVSSLSFRTIRTSIVSGLIGLAVLICVLLPLSIMLEDTLDEDTELICMMVLGFVLGMIYPTWHVVRRIIQCNQATNKKASRWKLIYDILVNLSIFTGGGLVFLVLTFLGVILSLTRWNHFVPSRFREMTGVDVVPESVSYYLIGIVLGIVAVFSQFIDGKNSEEFVGTILIATFFAFIAYICYKVHMAAPEDKKQVAWRLGYMAVTTYFVFIITAYVIFAIILFFILRVIYFLLNRSGGKGRYNVTCDNMTDDIINGRGICRFTNCRCEMRDTGVCPFK